MRTLSVSRLQIRTLAMTTIVVASGAIAALLLTGCRGGGANPGGDDLVIPFVEPTQSTRTCLNDVYPPDAPTFHEVTESDYRSGSNGVDYVVLEEGDGGTPEIDWQIEVKYTGWLEDGCVFGTTYGSGRDARFFLGLEDGESRNLHKIQVHASDCLLLSPLLRSSGAFSARPSVRRDPRWLGTGSCGRRTWSRTSVPIRTSAPRAIKRS